MQLDFFENQSRYKSELTTMRVTREHNKFKGDADLNYKHSINKITKA